MKYLLIYPLMILLLQKYVMSEDPCERNVIGAVGGAVTLQVNYTGVRKIVWTFEKISAAIATTRPGEPIEIDHREYKGRLSSTSNGSLIITEPRLEDRGTYRGQINTGEEIPTCRYHLTVFRNLTAEDVVITSNVTDNKTCEVTLRCSVNSSNVTVAWTCLNSTDINDTQGVVVVPPSHVNFTYVCTAENPVSNVSKDVLPWDNCGEAKVNVSPQRDMIGIYVSIGIFSFIFLIIVVVVICRRSKEEDPLDFNVVQNLEKGRKKNNVKGKEEFDPMCLSPTVYSQVQHPQEIPNVKQPTPRRKKGTTGMSTDPQATEPQESQSNETLANTLYSTVQHVKHKNSQTLQDTRGNGNPSKASPKPPLKVLDPSKQKNNQVIQPSPGNGNPLKASPKPPHKVSEPPKDKNDQTSPSEGPNENCSKSPVESFYAQVQPPKDKNDQTSPSEGPNENCSKSPVESFYAQVQPPKDEKDQKIPPIPANGNPSKAARKSPRKVSEPSKDKKDQKSPTGGPKGNCSNSPMETFYEEVRHPTGKNDQKSPSGGPKGDCSTSPAESLYEKVQPPKPQEPAKNCDNQYSYV